MTRTRVRKNSVSPYWSFSKARAFVRRIKLKSAAEFDDWCAGKLNDRKPKPETIPRNPHQVYKESWRGFPDWLGYHRIATHRREWLPFEEAREFARSLRLSSTAEWKEYSKGEFHREALLPENIPTNPNAVYRGKGWSGIADWLGYGAPRVSTGSQMLPLSGARDFARGLNLKSWGEWRSYLAGKMPSLPKRPPNVPAVPHECYRTEGWISYADFLGTDNVAWHNARWRPFQEARSFVNGLKLANIQEWRKWARSSERPKDIPSHPDKTYEEWKGFRDFLGTRKKRTFLS